MKKEIIMDIICTVLANKKSVETINRALNEFIPNYEKISSDYTSPPGKADYTFKSEEEMVRFFIENKDLNQVFYWNMYEENPHKIMIGERVTIDDKLIISLTFDGTTETKANIYRKLKTILNSDIGVTSYVNPPEYEDGQDFIIRYGN